MAKKKKRKVINLTPEQQLEANYQKAIRRMEGADKMYQTKDRVHMYRQAIKMFDSLGNYAESEIYKKWCKKRLPLAREQYREDVYQTGIQMKEHAKNVSDYEEAIEEFRKIKQDYKDVQKQIAECKQLKQKVYKNEQNRNIVKKVLTLAAFVAIIGIILFLRTPAAFYQEGKFLMSIKDYERASTLFARSIGYKDTNERRQECDYQRAISAAQKSDYKKALSVLENRVGDYKDALEKKAHFERKIMAMAEVGDTVTYGTDKWIVAEFTDGQALLIKKQPADDEMAYFASGKSASWEKSDLRMWLNQEFYQEHFSIYEQAAILQTEVVTEPNSVYGTDGGAATADKVFLLSETEAEQYGDLLAGSGSQIEWWLRTPGKAQNSAAFVSPKGVVMRYGYTVDAEEIAARPAMWVAVFRKNNRKPEWRKEVSDSR